MKNFRELLMHVVFFLTACISILAVILICVFLFANGVPAMQEIGFLDFLCGMRWKPGQDLYGIFPMIQFKDTVMVPLVGIMFGNIISGVTSFLAYRYEMTQALSSWEFP